MCYKRGGRRRNAALLRAEVCRHLELYCQPMPKNMQGASLFWVHACCLVSADRSVNLEEILRPPQGMSCYTAQHYDTVSSSGLAGGQVAEALASRGAVRASVSLLAALAQDALLEGWLSVAAGLLYRLLEISRPLVAVRFCHALAQPCTAPVSAIIYICGYRKLQGALPQSRLREQSLRSLSRQRHGIVLACTSLTLYNALGTSPHRTKPMLWCSAG